MSLSFLRNCNPARPQPNPPALTPGQVRYVRKAIALRKRLTYKALAARLCVAPITVQRAAHGRCED